MICPTMKLHDAISPISHQITRSVEPCIGLRREWILHETGGSQYLIVHIPMRNAIAADEEFTDNARRNWCHVTVQNIDSCVRNTSPDGNACPLKVRWRYGVTTGERRTLGGPIPIDKTDLRKRIQKLLHLKSGQNIATGK